MGFTARMFGLPAAVKVGFLDLSRCAAVKINLKGGRYCSCSSKILSVTLTSTAFAWLLFLFLRSLWVATLRKPARTKYVLAGHSF